ncbi:MAG: hypothetical protein QQN63_04555 [Nitrosopumilus sp.]
MGQKKQGVITGITAGGVVILITGGITYALNQMGTVEQNQTEHNIDKEAHPTIIGQLNMIQQQVAKIPDMSDEQIRQGLMLEQILKTVNGD